MPKDKPEPGKIYKLTGGSNDKCISNGNTWKESEVKENAIQPANRKQRPRD